MHYAACAWLHKARIYLRINKVPLAIDITMHLANIQPEWSQGAHVLPCPGTRIECFLSLNSFIGRVSRDHSPALSLIRIL